MIGERDAESLFGTFQRDYPRSAAQKNSEFLNYFGRLLVTGLFLDRRLSGLNECAAIDLASQTPTHDIHALMLNDDAQDGLKAEVSRSFGKIVWPDGSRVKKVCIRVSDDDKVPKERDYRSPEKMFQYRQLESEGNGMKSYVATCVSLLLGRRPVCLIDEPEMCLHPPQAYNLGQFIGRHANSKDAVTFVATHSSQMLRGAIQSQGELQIVRLTRFGSKFDAHLVPSDLLKEALAKPTVRAESVLDGIFAESVVIVEADGDRLVYQTTWETLASEIRTDIHVTSVGGIGGVSDTAKLYARLKIPVAVIVDLDFITDTAPVRRLLDIFAPQDEAIRLAELCEATMAQVKSVPPAPDPAELREQLLELANDSDAWVVGSDVATRRRLATIANKLDRLQRLKRGGASSYDLPIRSMLETLIGEFRRYGVFLVPVGELV